MGKVRDVIKGDLPTKEPVEFLSLGEWERKQRLAMFYMRRAGMAVGPDPLPSSGGLAGFSASAAFPAILALVMALVIAVTLYAGW